MNSSLPVQAQVTEINDNTGGINIDISQIPSPITSNVIFINPSAELERENKNDMELVDTPCNGPVRYLSDHINSRAQTLFFSRDSNSNSNSRSNMTCLSAFKEENPESNPRTVLSMLQHEHEDNFSFPSSTSASEAAISVSQTNYTYSIDCDNLIRPMDAAQLGNDSLDAGWTSYTALPGVL